ncbi:hypothetical protein [Nocardia salmonicida]|uniref:hypothetical protein n=1 Tax=Nocardia salmonicida TaxID=53431 RepID=UPI003CFBB80B
MLATTRDGRRPKRTVYAITGAGRDAVRDRLRALLSELTLSYSTYCVALAFLSLLTMEDAAAQLQKRRAQLKAELDSTTTSYELLLARGVQPVHVVEIRHAQAHLRADPDLTDGLVAQIREGRIRLCSAGRG